MASSTAGRSDSQNSVLNDVTTHNVLQTSTDKRLAKMFGNATATAIVEAQRKAKDKLRRITGRPSDKVTFPGCLVYLVFLLLCAFNTFIQVRPDIAYYNVHAVREELFHAEFVDDIEGSGGAFTRPVDFAEIENSHDFWNWMAQAIVPAVFINNWYDDDSVAAFDGSTEEGYVLDYQKLLGGVLVHQSRGVAAPCNDLFPDYDGGNGGLKNFYPKCHSTLWSGESVQSFTHGRETIHNPERTFSLETLKFRAFFTPTPYAHYIKGNGDGQGSLDLRDATLRNMQSTCQTLGKANSTDVFWASLVDKDVREKALTDKTYAAACFRTDAAGNVVLGSSGGQPAISLEETVDGQCCYGGQLEFQHLSAFQFTSLITANSTRDEASTYIDNLKKALWFDKSTREVTVTIPLFNGNNALVTVVSFILHYDVAGGFRKETSFITIPLFDSPIYGAGWFAEYLTAFYYTYGFIYIMFLLRWEYKACASACNSCAGFLLCMHMCVEDKKKTKDHDGDRTAKDTDLVNGDKEAGSSDSVTNQTDNEQDDDSDGVEDDWEDVVDQRTCTGRCVALCGALRAGFRVMWERFSTVHYMLFIVAFLWERLVLVGEKTRLVNKLQARNPSSFDVMDILILVKDIKELADNTSLLTHFQIVFFGMTVFQLHKWMELASTPMLLKNVVIQSGRKVFGFLFVLVVIMCTYALAGHILFPISSFRNLTSSLLTCLGMMMGTFDGYDDLAALYSEAGVVVPLTFFWSYTFIMLLLMLNLIIAIMADAWAEAKEDKNRLQHYPMLVWDKFLVEHWLCRGNFAKFAPVFLQQEVTGERLWKMDEHDIQMVFLRYWAEESRDGQVFVTQLGRVKKSEPPRDAVTEVDLVDLCEAKYPAIVQDVRGKPGIFRQSQVGRGRKKRVQVTVRWSKFSPEAQKELFSIVRRNQHVTRFRHSVLWPAALDLRSLIRTIEQKRNQDMKERPMSEWTDKHVDKWLVIQWRKENREVSDMHMSNFVTKTGAATLKENGAALASARVANSPTSPTGPDFSRANSKAVGTVVPNLDLVAVGSEHAQQNQVGSGEGGRPGLYYHSRRISFRKQDAFSRLTRKQFNALLAVDMDGVMLSRLTPEDLSALGDELAMAAMFEKAADKAADAPDLGLNRRDYRNNRAKIWDDKDSEAFHNHNIDKDAAMAIIAVIQEARLMSQGPSPSPNELKEAIQTVENYNAHSG